MKIIATNKKAYHDYFVISTFEAGLVLVGSEVKSIRAGFVNLKDSFISISKNDEFYVKNMYIKNYDKICYDKVDEKRDRKLLLNKSEMNKIKSRVREKGFTCVPLKIYFNDNQLVKLEIALTQGKHTYDKKEVLKQKDNAREVQREIKNYGKY